ncbi:MAG: superoxide dismutase [Candidatus Pacearchaeota archaeon]
MEYKLEPLPYDYDSLEPFIDRETMEVHYRGHHKAYNNKLNEVLEGHEELKELPAEKLLKNLNDLPEEIRESVRDFGGGFVNHNFLWSILKKDVEFSGEIAEEIILKFGSYEKFKERFSDTAMKLFGSGWVWLVTNNLGEIEIITTKNQDTPLSEGKIPLITIDMWEHAYYLKHQNKKANYIKDYFNVINWEKVNEIYLDSINK